MMKSKCFFVASVFGLSVAICFVSIFVGVIKFANAETHITEGYLYDNAVWTASSSPYIIEDTVTVPDDRSLKIEAGTIVIGAPEIEGYPIIYSEGDVVVDGRSDNRVSISGFGSISNSNGGLLITSANIALDQGLNIFGGTTTISDSTISSSTYGIKIQRGDITIKNSRIIGNKYGVFVEKPELPVYLTGGNDELYGVGGAGNAFSEELNAVSVSASNIIGLQMNKTVSQATSNDTRENQSDLPVLQMKITNSSIVDNTVAAITNEISEPISAIGNWWGDKEGPKFSGENMINGAVLYEPWLDKDPTDASICCSNILFIPGLQASRLYKDKYYPLGIGTSTSKLWEPLSYGHVQSLYLNSDGTSIDPAIYSEDIVDIALYTKGIYYKLIKFLDGLAEEGAVNRWKPFAYDWRKPIVEIVNGSEKRATTTESLIDTVNKLAAESKTGKVTIIAHSNGGLVAKYLVKVLADQGKADLIDKMISVAVPYLGTPQAILGLLHGSDQSIAFGLILKEYIARGLGENMSSAYSLLPSSGYFNRVLGPTIAFASTTVTGVNDGSYPMQISDFANQSAFISDTYNGREIASTTASSTVDTALAIRGNSLLMNASQTLHDILDPFVWPTNIAKWAIVGWNKLTTSGVLYSEREKCMASLIGLQCKPRPSHEKVLTYLGDGTVVAPSAIYNDGVVAGIDLQVASADDHVNINHAGILESSTTLAVLEAMIKGEQVSTSSLPSLPGVIVGEPSGMAEPTYLVVSTHSPVELHVYDSEGNHTGPIDPPVGTDIYSAFEANIPNSDFTAADEGDSYAYLPDGGEKYRLEVRGIGVGEFTLNVEKKNGAQVIDALEYAMVPVTPLSVASLSVQSGSSMDSLASTTSSLSIDEDGDGSVDATIKANQPFDPINYLEMYKKTISTIAGTLPRGKSLIKRIDKLENLIRAGKLKKAQNLSEKLDKKMKHMKFKKLAAADKQTILDMFDIFIQQYE